MTHVTLIIRNNALKTNVGNANRPWCEKDLVTWSSVRIVAERDMGDQNRMVEWEGYWE